MALGPGELAADSAPLAEFGNGADHAEVLARHGFVVDLKVHGDINILPCNILII